MKFFLYATSLLSLSTLVVVQGVQLRSHSTQSAAVGLAKKDSDTGFAVDGIIGLLNHIDEQEVNAIKKTEFEALVERWLTEMAHQELNATIAEVKDVFDKLDTDKNGELSKEEIIGAFFGLIDKNGNGAVDKKELRKLIRMYAKHLDIKLRKGWWRQVKQVFKAMDKDKSGEVTLEEVLNFLEEHGHKVQDFKQAVESLAEKEDGQDK